MGINVLVEHSAYIFTGCQKDRRSISWLKPHYPPVTLHCPITQKTVILNLNIWHFPWLVSLLYLLKKQTKYMPKNLCNTNKCAQFFNWHTIFYTAPVCFGITISPSSGSWHQNFFKIYSNKIGHNKCTYVMVSIMQNFTGFG